MLKYGVPQGSVIGPLIFSLYITEIRHIIGRHPVEYHIYADDIQLFTSFNPVIPGDAACAHFRLSQCLQEIQEWLIMSKLKFNASKTEFCIASSLLHYKSLCDFTFCFQGQVLPHSPTVRDLGVLFDHEMKMSDHVTQLCRSLNWQIYNLNRICIHGQ